MERSAHQGQRPSETFVDLNFRVPVSFRKAFKVRAIEAGVAGVAS